MIANLSRSCCAHSRYWLAINQQGARRIMHDDARVLLSYSGNAIRNIVHCGGCICKYKQVFIGGIAKETLLLRSTMLAGIDDSPLVVGDVEERSGGLSER